MLGRVGVDHLVHHYQFHRGKVESTLEDMGTQTLKNIAEPMRAWRVRIGPSSSPATKR